jgi:NADPH:quinone reductase-like Zn-dependent oxidoreductase
MQPGTKRRPIELPDCQPSDVSERRKSRGVAVGVGNWDALVREGEVELQPLPIILGSELSGIVEAIGSEDLGFKAARKPSRAAP